VQHTRSHTAIEHLGQVTLAVTSYRNEIRPLAFGSVYDRFHSRTLDDACSCFDPPPTNRFLLGSQIGFRLFRRVIEH
jgi:hypothetical protein